MIKKCPYCAEEIKEEAIKCKHCKADLYGSTTSKQASDNGLDQAKVSGIAGSILLFIGVFMPVLSIPIFGSMNYFQNGKGDGTVIIILAITSLFCTLSNKYRWLWFTGVGAIVVMGITVFQFYTKMADAKFDIDSQLAGNPFRGLADAAVHSVQLQWGWAVMLVGVASIMIAAKIGKGEVNLSEHENNNLANSDIDQEHSKQAQLKNTNIKLIASIVIICLLATTGYLYKANFFISNNTIINSVKLYYGFKDIDYSLRVIKIVNSETALHSENEDAGYSDKVALVEVISHRNGNRFTKEFGRSTLSNKWVPTSTEYMSSLKEIINILEKEIKKY